MKYVSYLLIMLLLFSVACKKQVDEQTTPPPGQNKIKIAIYSGNNQSTLIGQTLKDSIVIKITRGDTVLKNYDIQFTDSSCLAITATRQKTSELGLAKYSWILNATPGAQKLKVSVYDSVLKIRDSIFVSSEGQLSNSAWLPAGCLPKGIVNSLAQLKSGRIVCALNMRGVPYYSDDNGQSWEKLNSFPNGYTVKTICIGPNDEIYAAADDAGIFLSTDNGQSWEPRSSGITDIRNFTGFNLLPSGILMASTYYGGLYMSMDNGVTWTSTTLTVVDRYYSFSESQSGELFVIADGSILWKSVDKGLSWSRVTYSEFDNVQSLLIDSNGDMYIGTNGYEGHMFKSTNHGTSWTKIYTTPVMPGIDDRITRITMKNGYCYFTVSGYGLVRTKDFNNYDKLSDFNFEYLAATDGTVLSSNHFGVQYNHNP